MPPGQGGVRVETALRELTRIVGRCTRLHLGIVFPGASNFTYPLHRRGVALPGLSTFPPATKVGRLCVHKRLNGNAGMKQSARISQPGMTGTRLLQGSVRTRGRRELAEPTCADRAFFAQLPTTCGPVCGDQYTIGAVKWCSLLPSSIKGGASLLCSLRMTNSCCWQWCACKQVHETKPGAPLPAGRCPPNKELHTAGNSTQQARHLPITRAPPPLPPHNVHARCGQGTPSFRDSAPWSPASTAACPTRNAMHRAEQAAPAAHMAPLDDAGPHKFSVGRACRSVHSAPCFEHPCAAAGVSLPLPQLP